MRRRRLNCLAPLRASVLWEVKGEMSEEWEEVWL